MSAHERSGWRCEKISARHRLWGYNCPAVDLDFVVAEYNHEKPVALIEYKDKQAQSPDVRHPTYGALKCLANGFNEGALPFFIATYCSDDWWFRLTPMNEAAEKFYSSLRKDEAITEKRFVKSLYVMRKHILTINDLRLIEGLNAVLPQ